MFKKVVTKALSAKTQKYATRGSRHLNKSFLSSANGRYQMLIPFF